RTMAADYQVLAHEMGVPNVTAIPLSALEGDNVSTHSAATSWYQGPTVLEHLETVEISTAPTEQGFRFPVQWVCRPDHTFRGYAGEVIAGSVEPGDDVAILPSGARSKVDRIITDQGDLESAHAGDAVTITLTDERDISRGD